jgi:hypothetical protein
MKAGNPLVAVVVTLTWFMMVPLLIGLPRRSINGCHTMQDLTAYTVAALSLGISALTERTLLRKWQNE